MCIYIYQKCLHIYICMCINTNIYTIHVYIYIYYTYELKYTSPDHAVQIPRVLYGVSAGVAKISDSIRMPKSPSCRRSYKVRPCEPLPSGDFPIKKWWFSNSQTVTFTRGYHVFNHYSCLLTHIIPWNIHVLSHCYWVYEPLYTTIAIKKDHWNCWFTQL